MYVSREGTLPLITRSAWNLRIPRLRRHVGGQTVSGPTQVPSKTTSHVRNHRANLARSLAPTGQSWAWHTSTLSDAAAWGGVGSKAATSAAADAIRKRITEPYLGRTI